jgi:hypothetical protein
VKVNKATTGALAAELAEADVKKDIRKIDINAAAYKASELRQQLGKHVTDPRNKYFSRALVNRVWKHLVGRGFVEPVDDFREDNLPVHPKALDFLAEEFVASDYDLRTLVKLVVTSDAYQRAHAPATADEPTRLALESLLAADAADDRRISLRRRRTAICSSQARGQDKRIVETVRGNRSRLRKPAGVSSS